MSQCAREGVEEGMLYELQNRNEIQYRYSTVHKSVVQTQLAGLAWPHQRSVNNWIKNSNVNKNLTFQLCRSCTTTVNEPVSTAIIMVFHRIFSKNCEKAFKLQNFTKFPLPLSLGTMYEKVHKNVRSGVKSVTKTAAIQLVSKGHEIQQRQNKKQSKTGSIQQTKFISKHLHIPD